MCKLDMPCVNKPSLSGQQASLPCSCLQRKQDSRVTKVLAMAGICLICVSGSAPLCGARVGRWDCSGAMGLSWVSSASRPSGQQAYFPRTVVPFHPLPGLEQWLSRLWLRLVRSLFTIMGCVCSSLCVMCAPSTHYIYSLYGPEGVTQPTACVLIGLRNTGLEPASPLYNHMLALDPLVKSLRQRTGSRKVFVCF